MEIRDRKERLYGKNMDITPNGRVFRLNDTCAIWIDDTWNWEKIVEKG